MADQESSSIDNRSELAEIKEQMNQMMKIILDMQKTRDSEENTTAPITGTNRRKGVVIRYEDTTDGQEEQDSAEEDDDEQDEDHTHDLPPKGKPTSHQAETKINKGILGDSSSQEKEELELIKERLRVIEGTNFPDVKNAFEMCQVPDVVFPPKFKTPEFEKYDDTSCPKSHLHMYARKMTAHHGNDKLFIHCSKIYKYNEDDALDRAQLQSMVKKPEERFKDVNALIKVGEKIEGRIRSGKIPGDQSKSGTGKKPNFMKKKEGEALAVFTEPKGYKAQNSKYQGSYNSAPSTQPNYIAHNNNNQTRQNYNQTQPYQPQLYNHLLRERMISPIVGTVTESPGAWFNPNVTCEYHSGVIGHFIEHCKALKHKVPNLINAKQLHFKPTVPDMDKNPLPNHGNQGVNDVEKAQGRAFIWEANEIKTPMRVIFQEMCKRGMVEKMVEDEDSIGCELHGEKMLDMRLITIEREPSYQAVNATTRSEEDMRRTMRPSITRYEPVLNIPNNPQFHPQVTRWVSVISRMEPVLKPAAEEKPRPFPYKTDKAIEVTTIVGDSRITRSGRVYVPSDAEKVLAKDKGKGKAYIYVEDELEANLNDLLHNHGDKGEISNEEACQFLKFIKQGEYKVVDQLNRTPARISILSLLMSSEPHRKVLMEILNCAHVSHDITTDKLGGIINNIVADNYISFSDQEIPSEGMGHTNPLHISIMYQNCLIGKVLIDNGSSLNVMSKRTLSRLPDDASYMRPSSMVVKAFDRSNRDVMGEMELPIKIGPCIFQIVFHIMDINPSYSCLLGRSWIHASGVVPSTLHQ
ncbi:PREDICTED: uncharacterized protein LOC109341238 [Lupinus angustifolius]|uniref:uncharacterized protein LOC109341238 n=1 Tax=Lupinus angustifolius TaxID=3871 RepID=UPI00092F05EF|nr:PREDICTED: uncharacterized protein LOC109341238 [Lupinus angustifolius]